MQLEKLGFAMEISLFYNTFEFLRPGGALIANLFACSHLKTIGYNCLSSMHFSLKSFANHPYTRTYFMMLCALKIDRKFFRITNQGLPQGEGGISLKSKKNVVENGSIFQSCIK